MLLRGTRLDEHSEAGAVAGDPSTRARLVGHVAGSLLVVLARGVKARRKSVFEVPVRAACRIQGTCPE